MSDSVLFWLIFLLINFLLFLPGYLFDLKSSRLVPIGDFLKQKSLKQKINYFFVRENQDPFKFNGDLMTACAMCLVMDGILPSWIHAFLLAIVLVLSFAYLLYYYAMINIYQTVPVLYNDLQFAKVGWSIATQRFPGLFTLAIVGLIGVFIGLFYLGLALHTYLMQFNFGDVSYMFLMLIGVYNVYRAIRQKYVIIHKKLLVAPVIHLIKNIKVSIESRAKMQAWKPEFFSSLNLYGDAKLRKKPNIIIASIESYGAIINEMPALKNFFHPKLIEANHVLEEQGWYSTTTLSKAPRISGGSWLSHASFLYGIHINEFAIYESLMNNPVFEHYHSLLHVMKDKGYHNYYLNPLGGYDMSRINWGQIKRMFAADTIINDKSIDFKGKRTGSMGDSAPDQYAFHFGYEQVQRESNDPYSLFFITNNSHYSWLSPTQITKDWKSLDSESSDYPQTDLGSTDLVEKYRLSINYQLDIFVNFLRQEDPDNTILVLFGDHQPPAITLKESTFHAPVHILAKDASFIEGFSTYGFERGLLHDSPNQGINHQSFFSLFMKEFLQAYGEKGIIDPEYLPEGHQILG